MTQKILDSITPVFREVFDEPNLVVTPQLHAGDVASWDSLNHITLIIELESLTGLSFSTEELANLQNVGDFVKLLENKGYHG